jgi:hypothetical protein
MHPIDIPRVNYSNLSSLLSKQLIYFLVTVNIKVQYLIKTPI